MKKTLGYIATACGGILHPDSNPDRIVVGTYSDSRAVEVSKLFLAFKGASVDGNAFVPDVLAKGGCALIDREEYYEKDTVLVSDVRTALQRMARLYRDTELLAVPTVGITGSVGKTSTKDIVAHALSTFLRVHKTPANANSQVGLPQTVLDADSNDEVCVLELGMSMKGEMDRIAAVAHPDISVITNIGHSHIENLGSREAIRDEKISICSHSVRGSVLLVNGDEPLLQGLELDGITVYSVCTDSEQGDCYAKNITNSENGVCFDAVVFDGVYRVELGVIGKHYVSNALFALAVTHLLGGDVQKAAAHLIDYRNDEKRLKIYHKNGYTVVSDCYNAAPESMEAAINVLDSLGAKRKIAVLGDMLELGEHSKSLHTSVGGMLIGKCDLLITYGEQAVWYAEGAKSVETVSFGVDDIELLKDYLENHLREGDAVLYKASNGMRLYRAIV